MGTTGPTLKPYNALNGREIMEIILSEMRRQLEADYRFKQNLTYPLVSWEWKLAMNVYPNEPSSLEAKIGPKTIGDPNAAETIAEVQIDLGNSRDVTAPAGQTADGARRDAGIAVPSPRTVKGPGGNRMVVDAPEIKPTEPPAVSTQKQESKDVQKSGRVFARSVTSRTAAAPDGVGVDPPQGSAPDVERVQEIMEKEETQD
jgi:hypothetical protein